MNHLMKTLGLAAVLGLAAGQAGAQEKLKVGLLLTLSGPSAVLGQHARDGFQLAVKDQAVAREKARAADRQRRLEQAMRELNSTEGGVKQLAQSVESRHQALAMVIAELQGGSAVALNWAIDGVRKGGTVSVVGAYGPIPSAVKFGDALNKGLTLRMNQCPVKRQWPRLFEHVRNGYLKPSDIVTHRIPLEHIAEGYHIFSAKLDGVIKPIIVV